MVLEILKLKHLLDFTNIEIHMYLLQDIYTIHLYSLIQKQSIEIELFNGHFPVNIFRVLWICVLHKFVTDPKIAKHILFQNIFVLFFDY